MAKKKEPDKLAQDSSAVISANMSYGKYKALQYEAGKIPIIQKKEEPEHNTICRYCGKGFYTTKKIKVFCSDDCRIAHLKMKARKQKL